MLPPVEQRGVTPQRPLSEQSQRPASHHRRLSEDGRLQHASRESATSHERSVSPMTAHQRSVSPASARDMQSFSRFSLSGSSQEYRPKSEGAVSSRASLGSRSVSTPQLGTLAYEEQLIRVLESDPSGPNACVTLACKLPAMVRTCKKFLRAYVVAVDTALLKARGLGDGLDPFKAARKKLVAQECLCAPKYRLKEDCSTFTMELNPSPGLGGKAQVLLQVVVEAPVDPNFWTPVGKSVEAKAVAPHLELIMVQDYADRNPPVMWGDRLDTGCQTDAMSSTQLIQYFSRRKFLPATPNLEESSDKELLTVLKIIQYFVKKRKLVGDVERELAAVTEKGKRMTVEIDSLKQLLGQANVKEQHVRKTLKDESQARQELADTLTSIHQRMEEESLKRQEIEATLAFEREAAKKELKDQGVETRPNSAELEVQTDQTMEAAFRRSRSTSTSPMHFKRTSSLRNSLVEMEHGLTEVEFGLTETHEAWGVEEETDEASEAAEEENLILPETIEDVPVEKGRQMYRELSIQKANVEMELERKIKELEEETQTWQVRLKELEDELQAAKTSGASETAAAEAEAAKLGKQVAVLESELLAERSTRAQDDSAAALALELARDNARTSEEAKAAAEAKLSEVDKQNVGLQADLEAERTKLSDSLSALEAVQSSAASAAASAEARLASSEEQSAALESDLEAQKKETLAAESALEAAKSAAEAILDEAEKRNGLLQADLEAQKSKLAETELALQAFRKSCGPEVAATPERFAELHTQSNDLEAELAAERRKLAKAIAAAAASDESRASAEKKLASLQDELNKNAEAVSAAHNDCRLLREETASLTMQLEDSKGARKLAEEDCKRLQDEHSLACKQLQDEKEVLTKQWTEAKVEHENKEEECVALRNAHKLERKRLQDEHEVLAQQLKALQDAHVQKEDECKFLSDTGQKAAERWQTEKQELSKHLEASKDEHIKKDEEFKRLQDEHRAKSADHEEGSRQLKQATEEKVKLERALTQAKDDYKKKHEETEGLARELDGHKAELKKAVEQIKTIEEMKKKKGCVMM